ncbi:GFA family protein [Sphingopyxis sp. H115]|uniref:GFA family protein n=1 Tax=Sphingopyxis sp. H115 TaxID=1759073 RepID=UPI00073719CF|nr:GFA family protein [Sphingopyxis sp. H115]KTE11442.1 aldehyde-activating protein [Sphingopyxis sp. H115]
MAYEGSCHCGAVSFRVESDIPDTAMSCNCPHCRRKGFLLTFVPIDQFRLTSGSEKLTWYKFNKHDIDHQFCNVCGRQSFSVGTGPSGEKIAAVNLCCVPDADLDGLTIQKVDGASF